MESFLRHLYGSAYNTAHKKGFFGGANTEAWIHLSDMPRVTQQAGFRTEEFCDVNSEDKIHHCPTQGVIN